MRKDRGASLKELVNETLRLGLHEMDSRPKRRKIFRTQSLDAGALLIDDIDNVAEALAHAEGNGPK
jgi:hypothetical protein